GLDLLQPAQPVANAHRSLLPPPSGGSWLRPIPVPPRLAPSRPRRPQPTQRVEAVHLVPGGDYALHNLRHIGHPTARPAPRPLARLLTALSRHWRPVRPFWRTKRRTQSGRPRHVGQRTSGPRARSKRCRRRRRRTVLSPSRLPGTQVVFLPGGRHGAIGV